VHFTGIDHDHVASVSTDRSNRAPRAMGAGVYDPDSKLIVRVAWECLIRGERHCLNSAHAHLVLLGLMKPGSQEPPLQE